MPGQASWEADLRLGVGFMDDEHALLHAILDELGEAAAQGCSDVRSAIKVGMLLERLAVEAERHFAHEQRWMQRHRYPRLGDHRARHTRFLEELARFREQYATDHESEVTQRVLEFVQTWFARHTLTSDRALADWLVAHGYA